MDTQSHTDVGPRIAPKNEKRIVATINFKGGVGKTTLTVVLGSATATFYNKKVLFVDIDPQGNLTETMVPNDALISFCKSNPSAIKVMTNPTLDISHIDINENIAIVPSCPDDMLTVTNLVALPISTVKDIRLKLLLKNFDIVMIDLPPQMYNIVNSMVAAADFLITPVNASSFSLRALDLLLRTIYLNQLNPPKFLGAILTRFRTNETYKLKIVREYTKKIIRKFLLDASTIRKDINKYIVKDVFNTPFYHSPLWNELRVSVGQGPKIIRILNRDPQELSKLSEMRQKMYMKAISNAKDLACEFLDSMGVHTCQS